jgi:hypothetical protein
MADQSDPYAKYQSLKKLSDDIREATTAMQFKMRELSRMQDAYEKGLTEVLPMLEAEMEKNYGSGYSNISTTFETKRCDTLVDAVVELAGTEIPYSVVNQHMQYTKDNPNTIGVTKEYKSDKFQYLITNMRFAVFDEYEYYVKGSSFQT